MRVGAGCFCVCCLRPYVVIIQMVTYSENASRNLTSTPFTHAPAIKMEYAKITVVWYGFLSVSGFSGLSVCDAHLMCPRVWRSNDDVDNISNESATYAAAFCVCVCMLWAWKQTGFLMFESACVFFFSLACAILSLRMFVYVCFWILYSPATRNVKDI